MLGEHRNSVVESVMSTYRFLQTGQLSLIELRNGLSVTKAVTFMWARGVWIYNIVHGIKQPGSNISRLQALGWLPVCLSTCLPTYLSVCGCVSIAISWLVMRLRDATYLLIYTLIKLATSKRGRDCTGDDEWPLPLWQIDMFDFFVFQMRLIFLSSKIDYELPTVTLVPWEFPLFILCHLEKGLNDGTGRPLCPVVILIVYESNLGWNGHHLWWL